jgi:hypothetical protein
MSSLSILVITGTVRGVDDGVTAGVDAAIIVRAKCMRHSAWLITLIII